MSAIYSTKATVVGGRSGRVRTDDGLLDLQLALPREMGGKGGATNPEQLFAAGYAACFESAVIFHTRSKATKVRDEDIEVTAAVGLAPNGQGGFALVVGLDVEIRGMDQAIAEEVVEAAHAICPYSNAIRGNVNVTTIVRVL
jgi:osmotically inducible protein OsmC